MSGMTTYDMDKLVGQSYQDVIQQLEAIIYALKTKSCCVRKGNMDVIVEAERVGYWSGRTEFVKTGKRTFVLDMEIETWGY